MIAWLNENKKILRKLSFVHIPDATEVAATAGATKLILVLSTAIGDGGETFPSIFSTIF